MNETIQTLTNHRSIRKYKDQPLTEEQLAVILESIRRAPTSINGQQVSVIVVQNKERKKKLAAYTGNQVWVDEAPVFLVLCSDFYRAKLAAEKQGVPLKITDSVESLIVGATDVGIALGNAMASAESMGLGVVPIGGIRRNPHEVIELLNLPEYVIPVVGLALGHPDQDPGLKPRFNKEAICHHETYNRDLRPFIDEYDEEIKAYIKERTNGKEQRTWSETIMQYYRFVYYPEVLSMLQKQGYGLDE